MNLNPSGSLDSTWEGETDVPRPAALAETSPQSSSHHLLNPNDRTGGSVTLATATEFQESSAPPAQSVQCPADRWRRETTSLSCPQPGDQSWKRTRISPKPLPSRFTGSISALKPPPRPARQDRPPPRPGATLAGHSSSDTPKYGRGRLNYPLPDFSKVGPRVKFPKDETYRPPKARSHSRLPEGPARPLIFKSPAEIVRELLLNSGEVCPGEDPPPTHPTTRLPQEFQTPEQATKLVHQLQVSPTHFYTKAPVGLGWRLVGVGGLGARPGVPCNEDSPKPLAQKSSDCTHAARVDRVCLLLTPATKNSRHTRERK